MASPGFYRSQAVAVKTIKFRLPSDHAEFLKEVSAMNKLHHPNIGLHLRRFFLGKHFNSLSGSDLYGRQGCGQAKGIDYFGAVDVQPAPRHLLSN